MVYLYNTPEKLQKGFSCKIVRQIPTLFTALGKNIPATAIIQEYFQEEKPGVTGIYFLDEEKVYKI